MTYDQLVAKIELKAILRAARVLDERARHTPGESPGWKRGQQEACQFLFDLADEIQERI